MDIIDQYAKKASSDLRYLSNESPNIEVVKIKRVFDMGNLRAFVKVRVGPWILHACRVVQQRGQRAYAQLPMAPAKRRGYYPVLTCAIPQLDTQIKRAILAAFAEEGNYDY